MRTSTGKAISLALVHDYLTQQGGAERVALAIADNLPIDSIYSTVYSPENTYQGFLAHKIRTSRLNKVPLFRKDPRWALPFLPAAIDSLSIEEVDAVICSSSGWAHAVRTQVPKIVYFHTPARWLYESQDYLMRQSRPVSIALAASRRSLENWDKRSIAETTTFIANSTVVKERIERVYNVEATIIHPPLGLQQGEMEAIPNVEAGYWLTVARGRGYKNTEVIVEAAKKINQQIVVVGGKEASRDGVVHYTGVISDSELRWLYYNARALVAMSHEDFGLTPIEANSFGTPVLALRAGGYLDTVIEGENGLFVDSPVRDQIVDGMKRVVAHSWGAERIHRQAQLFSADKFSARLLDKVRDAIDPRPTGPRNSHSVAKQSPHAPGGESVGL